MFGTIIFGLLSAITWGIGDFNGGLAARQLPARLVVLFSQAAGVSALILLTLVFGEAALTLRDVALSMMGGVIGAAGLLLLYSIFASGEISVAASITGVVATLVPVLFGLLTQGLPHVIVLIGFVLAVVGVGVISLPSQAKPVPMRTLLLSVLCGACFGGFLIVISLLRSPAVFLPLVWARVASMSLLLALVLSQRQWAVPGGQVWWPLIGCGVMDALGNAFFVAAKQAGRLDVASALSSLYPASTVILALIFLKERMSRTQTVGVLVTLAAIPLISYH